MSLKKPTPSSPTLRQFAIDHIGAIATDLRKSDKSLTREQALAKAAQTPEGLEARRLYNMKGSHLPWAAAINSIVTAELTKAAGPSKLQLAAYTRWRAELAAKDGVTKSGSGPLGGRIEDPKISGPTRPADTLPNPADVILALIHAQALKNAPAGTSQAAATAAFLQTRAGNALHAEWNAARLLQGS
jgi:hypothetical protein